MVHSLWVFIKAYREFFDFKPATLLKMSSSKSIFYEFYLEFWLFCRTFLSILETAAFFELLPMATFYSK